MPNVKPLGNSINRSNILSKGMTSRLILYKGKSLDVLQGLLLLFCSATKKRFRK